MNFERKVRLSWSNAVREATRNYSFLKAEIVEALKSIDAEVRSAAVATINEANDSSLHDEILKLAADNDQHVREEVFEYLSEFPLASDSNLFMENLINKRHIFSSSCALNRLYQGPILNDDENEIKYMEVIEIWKAILSERGNT